MKIFLINLNSKKYFIQTDDEMMEKVLGGGYAAFDSSSGWMTRAPYLQCKVISLPIAYAEQVYEINAPVIQIYNKMK